MNLVLPQAHQVIISKRVEHLLCLHPLLDISEPLPGVFHPGQGVFPLQKLQDYSLGIHYPHLVHTLRFKRQCLLNPDLVSNLYFCPAKLPPPIPAQLALHYNDKMCSTEFPYPLFHVFMGRPIYLLHNFAHGQNPHQLPHHCLLCLRRYPLPDNLAFFLPKKVPFIQLLYSHLSL